MCKCETGYLPDTADKHSCQDINECKDQNGFCDQVCSNTKGSHKCTCYDGYRDNDGTCVDEDECHSKCKEDGHKCTNTEGGFFCYCDDNFHINDGGSKCSPGAQTPSKPLIYNTRF